MNRPNNKRPNIVYIFLITGIICLLAYSLIGDRGSSYGSTNVSINRLAQQIKDGAVTAIVMHDNSVQVTYKDRSTAKTVLERNTSLLEQLELLGVTAEDLGPDRLKITVKEDSGWMEVLSLVSYFLPMLLMAGAMIYFFKQQSGGAMSFGKSRARIMERPNVTFADVAGIEESKEELKEVVEFLKNPKKFTSLGARIPKGVLLVGRPGTGKTLMAKACAGEAGVPFFSLSGSEFVEMFVGVGASRVRDLFENARKNSPCIIFIDEIDAVGRQRGAGLGGSHDEREQTLNQLLVEMDGFSTDTSIIILAATNRPDILDPALLRPGRFDRQVTIDAPDVRGREQILEVHTKGKPIAPDVDLARIARATPGFVGADLENLVNESAILTARANKTQIGNAELDEAVEKVIAGPQKKSRIITEDEKRIIAYHEAGHAVVMNVIPDSDPIHKVTIIGRGAAGGYTMHLPSEDRILTSRRQLLTEMVGLMGGRAAESLKFNDITSGASNDIERATQLARTMVTQLGMSDAMGPLAYGKKEEMVFLGREISEQRNYSEMVAEKIDVEVKRLVSEAYDRAKEILAQYNEQLDAIANALLERETLTHDEFEAIFPSPNGRTTATPQLTA